MYAVDRNADGKISYAEFVPVCFDIIVELLVVAEMEVTH